MNHLSVSVLIMVSLIGIAFLVKSVFQQTMDEHSELVEKVGREHLNASILKMDEEHRQVTEGGAVSTADDIKNDNNSSRIAKRADSFFSTIYKLCELLRPIERMGSEVFASYTLLVGLIVISYALGFEGNDYLLKVNFIGIASLTSMTTKSFRLLYIVHKQISSREPLQRSDGCSDSDCDNGSDISTNKAVSVSLSTSIEKERGDDTFYVFRSDSESDLDNLTKDTINVIGDTIEPKQESTSIAKSAKIVPKEEGPDYIACEDRGDCVSGEKGPNADEQGQEPRKFYSVIDADAVDVLLCNGNQSISFKTFSLN